ncbi:MAG TPA: DUF4340 domain-containing protein [Desulfobacterales bacterium]|jgi:hypothetical protein|nr:DUF4340 domain-containing protein [Desulfobacterales bacterium]
MNGKKIVLLSTILFLLAGFYYFYEVRYQGQQKEEAASSRKVLKIKDDEIDRVCIMKSKDTLVLEKRDETWFLVQPVRARADTWAVGHIINTLADGTWEREVSPLPKNLADFGLADPDIEVTLSGKGLSGPCKVVIGAENPTGNMRYVRVGAEERVLLVYARFKDALDKTPDDLRDKHILRFEEDQVFNIVWRADGKTFAAERKENKWVLIEPAGEKISESQIKSLLWRLGDLKFKKIYEKPEHPLSYYGLNKPYGRIKLMDQEKEVILDLSLGIRKKPTVCYYTKVEGRNPVYELSYDPVKDLPEPEEGKEKKQAKK